RRACRLRRRRRRRRCARRCRRTTSRRRRRRCDRAAARRSGAREPRRGAGARARRCARFSAYTLLDSIATMERTHLLRHDLDWLPPGYRAVRWVVAGGLWTTMIGGLVGLGVVVHVPFYAFGKGLAVLAAGGAVAGDRAARGVLRGRLRKLARGAVDLSRLPAEPDGELVHVSGKVRALGADKAVYQRVVFSFDGQTRAVRETAQDFWLVGQGEPVLIEVADARLLADGKATTIEAEDPRAREFETLARPLANVLRRTLENRDKRRAKGKKLGKVRINEFALRDGDEVLGYKTRTIDPTMAMRLERDTPYRAALRGGKNLPLLIAPRPA